MTADALLDTVRKYLARTQSSASTAADALLLQGVEFDSPTSSQPSLIEDSGGESDSAESSFSSLAKSVATEHGGAGAETSVGDTVALYSSAWSCFDCPAGPSPSPSAVASDWARAPLSSAVVAELRVGDVLAHTISGVRRYRAAICTQARRRRSMWGRSSSGSAHGIISHSVIASELGKLETESGEGQQSKHGAEPGQGQRASKGSADWGWPLSEARHSDRAPARSATAGRSMQQQRSDIDHIRAQQVSSASQLVLG